MCNRNRWDDWDNRSGRNCGCGRNHNSDWFNDFTRSNQCNHNSNWDWDWNSFDDDAFFNNRRRCRQNLECRCRCRRTR